MVIPTTGIVFLFGAFVYFYLSRRFWRCYKGENLDIARLFSYAFLLLGSNYIVAGIPALFLIESETVWKVIAPLYISLLTGGWFLLGYAVFSRKAEKYKSIIAGFFFIWFISVVISTIFYTPRYFYVDGTLNWEIESILAGPVFLIMPIISILLIILFFYEAKKAKDKQARIRSLGFGLVFIILMIGLIIDFFLLTIFKLHPIYSDLNWLFMFLVLAITLVKTWEPPKPKWVKKIE